MDKRLIETWDVLKLQTYRFLANIQNLFNRNMGCIEMTRILSEQFKELCLIETWDVLKLELIAQNPMLVIV